MLQIWGQANSYSKFVIIMYFVLPVLLIGLTCIAEGFAKSENKERN